MQKDYRDRVMVVMLFGSLIIAVFFGIYIPFSDIVPDEKLVMFSTVNGINAILASLMMWCYFKRILKKELISLILISAGVMIVTFEFTTQGNFGKNVIQPYLMMIAVANLIGGFSQGIWISFLASIGLGILVHLQLVHPEMGEIAFAVSDQAHPWLFFARISFTLFAYSLFFGWISGVIKKLFLKVQQQKEEVEEQKKKVEEYANNIGDLYGKLKESVELQRDFINITTHEIRTPLGIILGYVETLQRLFKKQGEKATEVTLQKSDVAFIKTNIDAYAGKLSRLVDTMLALQQIDSLQEELRLQKGDLAEIAKAVFQEFRIEAEACGLDYELLIGVDQVHCMLEPKFAPIMLSCLIGNGLKYTEEGSVRVVLEKEGESFFFFIEDTGKGIAPEFLPHIFDKYGSERKTTIGGIGLYAVARIAKLMNGKVFAESELGKGSKIGVKIPALKEE